MAKKELMNTDISSELTIVIPAYNEAGGVAGTLDELLAFIGPKGWQVIVVNDGSTDATAEILDQYANRVQVIHHPYNMGYGASLKTGIRACQTDFVAIYDSDGQHRPEDLAMLVAKAPEYDMVVGQRDKGSNVDVLRVPGKFLLTRVANILAGRKIPDLNSGLRVFRRSFLTKVLHLMPDGFSFTATSTLAAFNMGFTVGYFPIQVRKRIGTSSVKQIRHGSIVFILILRLIIMFSPLRIFFPVSALIGIVGVAYEIYIIVTFRLTIANGALLMILTSIMIFFFGLLVDQVSAMRRERYMYEE